jgi:hypothetical protein
MWIVDSCRFEGLRYGVAVNARRQTSDDCDQGFKCVSSSWTHGRLTPSHFSEEIHVGWHEPWGIDCC